jgi:biotin transport system substrate-specific component
MPANAPPGTLLSQTLPQSSLATPIRVGSLALAVALTAVAAQFTMPLPFTVVPFTLTPMVVLLTGAALGSRLGALTQILYLSAGLLGAAVFAPSLTLPPGPARLLGPTGGYLMAYPLAAFVTGWLAERGWDRRYLTSFAAMAIGLGVIYAGGASWLTTFTRSVPAALATGVTPFVLPDLLKLVVAAMILPQTWRLIGRGTGK